MKVAEKRRILTTKGVVGEIKIYDSMGRREAVTYYFKDIRKSEAGSCCMMVYVSGEQRFHLDPNGKLNVEIWDSGLCHGYVRQFIHWRYVSIVWCRYAGVAANTIKEELQP